MSKDILCFDKNCTNSFVSIDGLKAHGNYAHPGVSIYRCRFENCGRTFDLWGSFSKHLKNKHNCSPRFSSELPVPTVETLSVEQGSSRFLDIGEADEPEVIINVNKDKDAVDFYTVLKTHADILVAKWYNKPGLPRNIVDLLINDVTSFLDSGLEVLKNDVLSVLHEVDAKPCKIDDISNKFDGMASPFNHLKTEYLREKYFRSSGWYINPVEYVIELRPERQNRDGSITIKMKPVTGQFFPLKKILKNFFELPDALSASLKYMEELEQSGSDEIFNLTQCHKWKNIRKKLYKADDIVLPILVYCDEYEPNNALGPHCEKIGCVYIDLPSLPPECQSKLENIFEGLLYNAEDRKSYGNQKVFRPLIDELKFLEREGIVVNTPLGENLIFFATAALKGDNLGLAGMCGFVECFVANYPCRTCKACKSLTQQMLVEDPFLLRTEENYQADVLAERPDLTGIKEDFVFKDVQSLYCDGITSAFLLDAMHDVPEGIAHYTIIPVLKHFHQKDPLFLSTLNQRMYMFDYGKTDGRNEPVSITAERLDSNKLKMTANEMIIFVRFLGLFVGHLVEEEDEYWQLYLLLHDIMSILQAKSLPSNIVPEFQCLVQEHHALYIKLTGETLKPKHHYLLHYGSLFENFGTFGNISCMRDEARHKINKAYTNVCLCRKNVLLSLATKRMFSLCLRFILKESILPPIVVGPGDLVDLSLIMNISSHHLPKNVQDSPEMYSPKWVEFKGTRYNVEEVLAIGIDESRCPVFATIKIIIPQDEEVVFLCERLLNLGFNLHVRGFEIQSQPSRSNWVCKRPCELLHPFPLCLHTMANGEKYIVPKSYL